MAKKRPDTQSKAASSHKTLRERAESMLRATRTDIAGMPKEDLQALVHELQVHQMELEIQNEELRLAQLELAQSRDRYSFLYDFAPTGYVTVNAAGRILEANLTAATMLGTERQALLRGSLSSFVAREAQDTWYLHREAAFSGEIQQSCELAMRKADGTPRFVRLESIAPRSQPDRRCHTALVDVTERKQIELALRESEERLVNALAAMTRLHQLVTRLLVCSDLPTALEEILDATIALLGADMGTIQLLDPRKHALAIVAQRGFKKNFLDYFRTVRIDDDSAYGRAMKRGGRVVIENVKTDASYASQRTIASAAGYRAVQSTPLMSRDRELLGVLSDYYSTPHCPSDRELKILDLYARQAADFIERKRGEEALRESEERFRKIFENAAIGMAQVGLDGQWLRVNDKLCEITGYSREELLAGTFRDITHPDDLETDLSYRQQMLAGELETYSMERRCVHKEGFVVWTNLTLSLVRKPQTTEPLYFIAVTSDIAKRKHAEEQLRQLTELLEQRVEQRTAELTSVQEQLRALTSRLHDLQEKERARLARELHDEFGAALTALKIDLHWIMERLPQKTNGLEKKIKDMSELIDQTVDSVRRTAALLRPRLLDDFGLVAAIEWQIQDFQKRTGIQVLTDLAEEIDLNRECSTAVFRILQEALTNVARHAKATEIVIRLRENSDKISLEVKDNGIGISSKAISNVNSFGLFGMQERAYAFGGHVRITGRRGRGTTVSVEIPRGLAPYGHDPSKKTELSRKVRARRKSKKSSPISEIASSRNTK